MSQALRSLPATPSAEAQPALFAPGASQGCAEEKSSYWPADLLHSFTLLMGGAGHSVSASLMLGDRHYALEQLAHAHTSNDDGLRALAVRMFTYFDDQHAPSVPCHA